MNYDYFLWVVISWRVVSQWCGDGMLQLTWVCL